jgi:hypothetical protein
LTPAGHEEVGRDWGALPPPPPFFAALLVLSFVALVGAAVAGAGLVPVAGVEGVAGLHLVVMLQLELLEEEVKASAHEGVRRELGGDDGLDVAILRVEVAEEIEHLARLGHRLADIAEVVGELLEAGGVLGHAHVALVDGAELGLEVDRALQLVVAEDALDVGPGGVGGGVRFVDDVEDVLGVRGVDPIDHTVVNHGPLRVALGHRRRRGDVSLETKLAEGGVEEASPLAVIGLVKVEDDRDVGADVDGLKQRGWSRQRRFVTGAGGGGVRRGSHGDEGAAEEGSSERVRKIRIWS